MNAVLEAPIAVRFPGRRRRWRLPMIAGAMVCAVLTQQAATWPNAGVLRTHAPSSTAFIDRARGAGVQVEWRWVAYQSIATPMKVAVLVAEDARFFQHGGFDHVEMRAALRDAWRDRAAPRGASTITQQLARNLWLSSSRDPLRKLKEALLTMQLERTLSKRRILELYLNVAQFGSGIFGVEAAALHFYGVSASQLTPAQAASLAALLPAPAVWDPLHPSPAYARHRAVIRARMRTSSYAALL